MDPFTYFPSEVCDSILEHLTGNEILEASKVSKTWYSIIGASSKTMQKLKLRLFWLRGQHRLTCEMSDILVESNRRYQNVVIKFQSHHIDDFKLIMEPECRNWKKVQIERLVFKSAGDVVKILKSCQNTVVELELDNLYVKNAIGLETLNFPKLKSLRKAYIEFENASVNDIFTNCKKLEELTIISGNIKERAIKSIKTILKNNSNLKHLEMTSQQINSIFDEDMSVDFKLDTFIATSYCHLPPIVDYKHIILNQFQNLKNLSVDSVSCPNTLKLIFKIPKLKCLNIGNIDTTSMLFTHKLLSINKSIEELGYQDHENDFYFMQCLVDAVPNLKKAEFFSLTQNMMEYMSSSLKELEALKLRSLDVTNLSSKDLFPKLKKVKIDILSANLHEHMLSIPFDDCNPLVMLLKDSGYIILN
ncbi:hypothetical protein ACKWTF_004355 [Chironomus riparius]